MFEELAFCDSCGNYVPTVEEDGSLLCAYEYAEYPDIATVVGQHVGLTYPEKSGRPPVDNLWTTL